MFTAVGQGGYVAEKAEGEKGWLFPVGDEVGSLGYTDMFADMLNAADKGMAPMETFYDGYVVNAIVDACYASAKSKKWEAVRLDLWRGADQAGTNTERAEYDAQYWLIKTEVMPDGKTKHILKDKNTGDIVQKVTG
jgi:hypothetical protein